LWKNKRCFESGGKIRSALKVITLKSSKTQTSAVLGVNFDVCILIFVLTPFYLLENIPNFC
jgi:hypothetical protein